MLDPARIKTLPSRLGVTDLARLAAGGARPASSSPLPTGTAAVIEIGRTVNVTGLISLGDQQVSVGLQLAGRRVTPVLGFLRGERGSAGWTARTTAPKGAHGL
jgi:hypothetical protein